MAQLIYSTITSLDGYVEDSSGAFDWAMPDDELHGFINDLERTAGTHLYGRRMYETMAVWETDPALAAGSAVTRDFSRIWQAAHKIVFSQTLGGVVTSKTRLERQFEPEVVRHLKATSEHDLLIGGSTLAGHALSANLVDECHLFVVPVVVGGGKPTFQTRDRLTLDLLEEKRFGSGTVYLRYRVR